MNSPIRPIGKEAEAQADLRSDSMPLAGPQQEMLLEHAAAQSSGVDLIQVTLPLGQKVNATIVGETWERVMQRHEILRVQFSWEGHREPHQQVLAAAPCRFGEHDWSDANEGEVAKRLQNLLGEERTRGLEMSVAPIMRLHLIHARAESVVVWSVHCALVDRPSVRLIVEDFLAGLKGGRPGHRAVGFSNYVNWIGLRDMSGDQKFWSEYLARLDGGSCLTDVFHESTRTGVGVVKGELPLASELQTFASSAGISLETLFTGMWAVLLSRYLRSSDVLLGVPLSCRSADFPEATQCVGPLSNVLPARFPIESEQPAIAWLRNHEARLRLLQDHSHASLHQVHKWLGFTSDAPMFDTVVEVLNKVEPSVPDIRRFYSFPLVVTVDPGVAGQCIASFSQQQFSEGTVAQMLVNYRALLQSLLDSPEQPIGLLKMLSAQQEDQLVERLSHSQRRIDPAQSVIELILRQARQRPEIIAVEHETQSLTFRQLDELTARLSAQLREMGVGPEIVVGVYFDRTVELIVALLSVLRAGGAYLPLDPAYPAERVQFMLEDTKAPIVLTSPRLKSEVPPVSARIETVELGKLQASRSGGTHAAAISGNAHSLAYIIYTSGSTGKPKGVQIEQRSLVHYAQVVGDVYKLEPGDRVLQFASVCFDASVEEIFCTLVRGATLVLRTDEMISSARGFLEKIGKEGVSVLSLPTAYWHELASGLEREKLELPTSVRLVVFGGERALPDRLRIWLKRTRSTVRLINAYGPTEATVGATWFEVPREGAEAPSHEVPIGGAIPNYRLFVVDEHLRLVPSGVPGELLVGGVGVARGYLNRPELQQEKFIASPFAKDSADILYRTGDLVRFNAAGQLEFFGRVDQQVKIRGFRIELGEIESVLNQFPAVRESVAVAREMERGEKKLVAYMTTIRVRPQLRELRHFLKTRMPAYMVPSHFVFLEKFPMTPSGKIDRRALPAPTENEDTGTEELKLPQTPLEMQLKMVFEKFLNRRPIGTDVSFFELGGDSLQALQLIVEIENATGKKLPLGILYQASTIEDLARAIENLSADQLASSLVLLQQGKRQRPPLFLVHTTPGDVLGYGNLIFHLQEDQPCYGFQSLGYFDPDKAHQNIEEMAAYYVKQMREVQPHGPYYMGGWCYGGMVSVEMAHQLRAVGEEVALLALIETPAPPPAAGKFSYFLRRVGLLLRAGPRQWFRYLKEKYRYYRGTKIADNMRFKRADANDGLDEIVQQRNQMLERLERVYRTNLEAIDNYRSRPYPGRVVLFNAGEQDPASIPDPLYGWPGLAGEIVTHVIPGDHDTVLMEPNVQQLVRYLENYLPNDSDDAAATPAEAAVGKAGLRGNAMKIASTYALAANEVAHGLALL